MNWYVEVSYRNNKGKGQLFFDSRSKARAFAALKDANATKSSVRKVI